MKNLFQKIILTSLFTLSIQFVSGQEVKPVKKAKTISPAVEKINCTTCPALKDSKGHVLDRVAQTKKNDSITKGKKK